MNQERHKLQCFYCGYMFIVWIDELDLDDQECPKCDDKRVKVISVKPQDVFGYRKKK